MGDQYRTASSLTCLAQRVRRTIPSGHAAPHPPAAHPPDTNHDLLLKTGSPRVALLPCEPSCVHG
eukprot:13383719-Heterocapsa_arctica.AAC.1